VSGGPAHPRLVMEGVRKSFGPTLALDAVDLRVEPGEVHAVVGENGAGKSTLMKVLSGALLLDSGRMWLDGVPFRPRGPHDARSTGVAMIYQELNLAPHLSVQDNLMLGIEPTRLGFLDRSAARDRVTRALEELRRPEIRPETAVGALSIGARQLVEIARALVGDARVVVLDEPTSSLPRDDARHLFALIQRLRARGVSLVYISHFLEEVQQVADRFTVLRDGRVAGSGPVAETSSADLVSLMVGRRLEEMFPRLPHEPGAPALSLEALSGERLPRDVDLTLHRGEILGLAGLIGAGRTELVRTVFGLDPVKSGRISVAAAPWDAGADPAKRLAQGVGMLSEDRKSEGLALPLSIADNLTLSRLGSCSRWGWLDRRRQRSQAAGLLEALRVRAVGPEQAVWHLSGGNQQRVALGRLLHQGADVLLLDEPTRGIDVGAKVQLYTLIGELARKRKAILFVSSYLPELLGVCDRVGVMSRGRLVALRPAEDWTEHEILLAATGEAA